MKLSKNQVEEILKNYNLGRLKKLGKIMKNDVVSLGQEIVTTQGRYFLKVHKSFALGEKQGLEASYLLRKNIPSPKIYLTKKKSLFLGYKNYKIIIFEFLSGLKSKWEMNKEEIRDFSKTLARFHKQTRKMKFQRIKSGNYQDISSLIKKYYNKRRIYPKNIQKSLEFMKKEIENLPIPENQYLTGFYSEFYPGHVYFKHNKVVSVIDWMIGREEAFYDIGSSLIACFSKNGKKFFQGRFKDFIDSYNKVRKMTKWEKEHIFDALKFGILKTGIWGFFNLQTGKMASENKIDRDDLNLVLWLMRKLR